VPKVNGNTILSLLILLPSVLFSQVDSQALEWDIENGDVPRILANIQRGRTPEVLPNGKNPLLYALEIGHREVIREILKVTRVDASQDSLYVNYTASLGRLDVMAMLRDLGLNLEAVDERDENALFAAARREDGRMLRFLLTEGLDVDHTSLTGVRALQVAVGQGNLEAARALVEAGADIFHQDLFGRDLRRYLGSNPPPQLQAFVESLFQRP
jgi:ankyrin repeat protein